MREDLQSVVTPEEAPENPHGPAHQHGLREERRDGWRDWMEGGTGWMLGGDWLAGRLFG